MKYLNEEEHIPVITDREKLYDKCENMEQLFDKYYLPLLDKHYSKTYKLQQERNNYKELYEKEKEKVEMYENPDDLTLFYMWLDTKAKDKMKRLTNNWNELKEWIKNREDEAYIYTKVLDKMEVIERL